MIRSWRVSRLRGERLRFDARAWRDLAIAGALLNAIPFTLFAFGEKHVSSVSAGLWNATTPLWVMTVVLAAFPEEELDRARIAGLAVGFAGAVLVLGPWRVHQSQLIGELACAGAALCYGLGFPYTRRHLAGRSESSVVLSAGQLLCATAMLAATIPFARPPTTHIGLDGLGSILALGVFGSGVAYLLNYSVVRAAGAAVASAVAYLIPIVSTVLGVIVLGETLSWNQPVGAAVLLIGIAVSQGRVQHAIPRISGAPSEARNLV